MGVKKNEDDTGILNIFEHGAELQGNQDAPPDSDECEEDYDEEEDEVEDF